MKRPIPGRVLKFITERHVLCQKVLYQTFRSVVHPKAGSRGLHPTPPHLPRIAPALGRHRKRPETLPSKCSSTHLRDADLQHGPLRPRTRLLRESKALGPDHMPAEVMLAQGGLGGPREGGQQRTAPGCQFARAGPLCRLGLLPRRHVALRGPRRVAKARKQEGEKYSRATK